MIRPFCFINSLNPIISNNLPIFAAWNLIGTNLKETNNL